MKTMKCDLTGQRFGLLVVQETVGISKFGHRLWLCKCDCGNTSITDTGHLHQKTRSCGCIKYKANGNSSSRLYGVWQNMKDRCFNQKHKSYKGYGGRGITICKEWLNFNNFYDWAMNHGYKPGLSIDRINNDGNYEPSNCRWSDAFQQQNNKSDNHYLVFNGQKKTATEWARVYGINPQTLISRLRRGWPFEKAITDPVGADRRWKGKGRKNGKD